MSGRARVLGVIPSRYGSSRLPGKPLADILGKPMIQHVYERAVRCASLGRVVVATDDERIFRAVQRFGGEVVMTPESCASGTDRIAAAVDLLGDDAEIIANVQGDEPLLDPAVIDELVRPLLDDPAVQMATVVRRLTDPGELVSRGVCKVVLDAEQNALFFTRAAVPVVRDEPDPARWLELGFPYYAHVGLYAYRRELLRTYTGWAPTPAELAEGLEQLRALHHGVRLRATVTAREIPPAVDTPADLDRVRSLMKSS